MHNLVLFGGTFDPVHNGHLFTALAVQAHFHFERFILLPCKEPVLKQKAIATPNQRVEMLRLAFQSKIKEMEISQIELQRRTPSYMYDTLASFRAKNRNYSISVLLGLDAFCQLPKWYRWEELLNLGHLIIIERPDIISSAFSKELLKLLLTHETRDQTELLTQPYGRIYRLNAGQYPISSTWIRKQLLEGNDTHAYLPAPVWSYIKTQQIYQHHNNGLP